VAVHIHICLCQQLIQLTDQRSNLQAKACISDWPELRVPLGLPCGLQCQAAEAHVAACVQRCQAQRLPGLWQWCAAAHASVMEACLRHMLDEALWQQEDAILLAVLCPGCHNVRKLRA
jgi:hypothetical protein